MDRASATVHRSTVAGRDRWSAIIALIALLAGLVVSPNLTATAEASTEDSVDYVAELRRFFGPLTGTDVQLQAVLDGPTGAGWESFVELGRFGEVVMTNEQVVSDALMSLHDAIRDQYVDFAIDIFPYEPWGVSLAAAQALWGHAQGYQIDSYVQQFADAYFERYRLQFLHMYVYSRLGGNDPEQAYYGELEALLDTWPEILEAFGVTEAEYRILLEDQYQAVRVSRDPDFQLQMREALNGLTGLLADYASGENLHALLAGTGGLQLHNSGPSPATVTYRDGQDVLSVTALPSDGLRTAAVDWAAADAVRIDVTGAGTVTTTHDQLNTLLAYEEPRHTSEGSSPSGFVVDWVAAAHGGEPHTATVDWQISNGASGTTAPNEVLETELCPGKTTATATIQAGPHSATATAHVARSDPWGTSVARSIPGVVPVGAPLTLSAMVDAPAGTELTYSWRLWDGSRPTDGEVLAPTTRAGVFEAVLVVYNDQDACVRVARTHVHIGDGVVPLPKLIDWDFTLEPFVTYEINPSNTTVLADSSLTVPEGTILKGAAGDQLAVAGTLVVDASSAHPATFASIDNDAVGFDARSDGQTAIAPWGGIVVWQSGTVTANHLDVLDTGTRSIDNAGSVTLTHGTLTGLETGAAGSVAAQLELNDVAIIDGGTINVVDSSTALLRNITADTTGNAVRVADRARVRVEGLVARATSAPIRLTRDVLDTVITGVQAADGAAIRIMTGPGAYPARAQTLTATTLPYAFEAIGGFNPKVHTLSEGASLTVAPGVRMLMEPDARVNLYGGRLTLAGTAQRPITIDQAVPGSPWPGFLLASGGPRDGSIRGRHVTINGTARSFSGHGTVELTAATIAGDIALDQAAHLTLTDVTLPDGDIILTGTAAATATLTDLTMAGTQAAISIGSQVPTQINGLTAPASTQPVILSRSSLDTVITDVHAADGAAIQVTTGSGAYPARAQTITSTTLPYRFRAIGGFNPKVHTLPEGASLTVAPGVRMLMEPDARINLYGGHLTLAGTAAQPITIDQAVAGSPWPGVRADWRGTLTGDHVVLDGAVRHEIAGTGRFTGSQILDPVSATGTLDAVANWWGAASGPAGVGTGTGSTASGNVAHDPWCLNPECTELSTPPDTTAPVVAAVPARNPDRNGWYRSPVDIEWTVTDDIDDTIDAPPVVSVDTEGADQTATSEVVCDIAGNCSHGTAIVSLDLTPPTIAGHASSGSNEAGWFAAPVEVTFDCHDDLSGIEGCTEPATVSGDGSNQTATGTATDLAGHTATVVVGSINIDQTPPEVVIDSHPDDAIVRAADQQPSTCSATDTTSGLHGECTLTVEHTPADPGSEIVTLVATARDIAGNVAVQSRSYLLVVDADGPAVDTTLDAEPNSAGWFNDQVVASFTCTDPSGVATCPGPHLFDNDGADQTTTLTATDVWGNSTAVVVDGINIDQTPPDVTFVGARDEYAVYEQIDITCEGSDSLSGLLRIECDEQQGLAAQQGLGEHTVRARAIDFAGNETFIEHTYTVVLIPGVPPWFGSSPRNVR